MSAERGTASRRMAAAWAGVLLALAAGAGAGCAFAAKETGKAGQGLSDADKACVACHDPGGAGAAKAPSCAESRHAFHPEAFARSAHGSIGCEGCHDDVTLPAHPGDVKKRDNACKFAKARSEACRACHARISKAYDRSLHAVLHREGKPGMPVCGDCHASHAVAPPSVQEGTGNACLGCHAGTIERHGKWLPNAAAHMRAVACSACHAPAALRRVDLRLHRDGRPLADSDGTLRFEERARAADANSDGLGALELRELLAGLERDGVKVALKGRIELRAGQDAHELPAKAKAIRECVKCHDESAAPFQNVALSVLDASGRPVRYDAHKEVLVSPATWEALRGFYAIGGTRFKLLDYVLLAGLAVGVAVPLLHLGLRRLAGRRANEGGGNP